MKALSIRQPWAWAILQAGKRIENRAWRAHHRGPLLIHASASRSRIEFDNAVDWMLARELVTTAPAFADLPRGAIVGIADVIAVDDWHESPWFVGPYGIELANVRAFAEPIPYRGTLGLFYVPDDLVRRALEEASP